MRVGLALFAGDELLTRHELLVGVEEYANNCSMFQATHALGQHGVDIVLANFPVHVDLKTITLDMPIHESADWGQLILVSTSWPFGARLIPGV